MAFKSLLEWWQQAGVDILTQESPRDWLLESSAKNISPQSISDFSEKKSRKPNKTLEGEQTLPNFNSAESSLSPLIKNIPQNISDFLLWLQEIFGENCVFSDIKISPDLMVLSASPEAEDIEQKQLFSGKMGQLLSAMLETLSIKKQDVYFATMSPVVSRVDYMDISNKEDSALNFHDYSFIARHHICLIKPRYLLLLGDAPNRALLQMNTTDARGKIHAIAVNNDNIDAFALLHPKMLLETPSLKAIAWKDLRVLKRKIDENANAFQ